MRKSVLTLALCMALGVQFVPPTDTYAADMSVTSEPLLVNKSQKLPDGYENSLSLVTVQNCFGAKFKLDRETYRHFLELRQTLLKPNATTAGAIQIEITAAYRNGAQQRKYAQTLPKERYANDMVETADPVGYSEHQTGMALDFTVVEEGKPVRDWYNIYETSYQQVHRLLAEHGFILRYPPGKSDITGHPYESWHIRYVGQETALKIYKQGLTLEEYLAGGDKYRSMKNKLASAEYWTSRNPGGDVVKGEDELQQKRDIVHNKGAYYTDLTKIPEKMTGDEVRKRIAFAKSFFWWYELETFYEHGQPVDKAHYWQVADNDNMNAIPTEQPVQFALAKTRTSIRYMPYDGAWYEDPYDSTYDLLQAVPLDPGEPVAVLAESRDKEYYFIEAAHHSGWVKKKDLLLTNRDKWLRYVNPEHFLVVTANKKRIPVNDGYSVLLQMGGRLPLASPDKQADGTWLVVVPVEVENGLQEKLVRVPDDDTVHKGWLPYTENNVIRQSFRFLGDIFDWGGQDESVDCTTFTTCVYRSMGLNLPTDAEELFNAMPNDMDIKDKPAQEKFALIKKNLRPGDFVFTDGHSAIYLGLDDEQNEPYVIQCESSRFFPSEGENGTSLKYYNRRVLVDNMRFMKKDGKRLVDVLVGIGSISNSIQ